MNILFVANRFPFPPHRGDKLKIYNLTRRLAKTHTLYLVTFYEKRDELNYLSDISPYFKEIELVYLPQWKSIFNCIPALLSTTPLQLAYFRSNAMHRMVKKVINHFSIDVVHTQHLRMSQYTKDLNVPKILDLPDAFSLYFKRRSETERPLINRLIDRIEIKRLAKAEQVIKKFDQVLVCSVEDKTYLQKLHQVDHIDILLNGVDLETFDCYEGHDYTLANTLLFTGNMDYAPNVDAVIYFVKEMWPQILKINPNTKFIIAGQRPIESVKKLESNSIKVTGFVEDISDLYRKSTILIAPLRFGAGTQNKVLEAMAMGVPVVCTHIGFEGLQINNGDGVYMEKGKHEFITRVNELLRDQDLRTRVGKKGLNIAHKRFSWDSIAHQLNQYIKAIK
ncbi:glycosyltransferase [Bacteroidia bacterium]|nr:glycosyltransferase [Bacteroidia bacterium]